MISAPRLIGQGVVYAAIAVVIGYFADSPSYSRFPPDQSQILLSFNHGAKAKGGCRRRTAAEIAKLAPNMRRPLACPRRRLPVVVKLALDGKTLYRASIAPGGLSGDGPAQIYRKFAVTPGRHRLEAWLRDSDRKTGFDYQRAADIVLQPGQRLVVDFRAETGGFVFQ
jgi:hypothetical protein